MISTLNRHSQIHHSSSKPMRVQQYGPTIIQNMLYFFLLFALFPCDHSESISSLSTISKITNSFQAMASLEKVHNQKPLNMQQEEFPENAQTSGLHDNLQNATKAANKLQLINTQPQDLFLSFREQAQNLRRILKHVRPPKYRLRLNGSQLSYMGQVQVLGHEGQWKSICGDDWDKKDAMVVCRQLGFSLGGVIARRSAEFGNPVGPFAVSKVQCRGGEKKLGECGMQSSSGGNTLPCSRPSRPASVVCGCRMTTNAEVLSRCKIFTKSQFDRMYCRYTCPSGKYLVGSPRRYCETNQRWSGVSPRCVTADPCHSAPCSNGGTCERHFKNKIDYVCLCQEGFGGKSCEFERPWSCGREVALSPLLRPRLRIVGGTKARKGSWPWVVQLRLNNHHFCGGTLVSPAFVITAQHCLVVRNLPSGINYNKNFTVVSGQHQFSGRDITSQRHQVAYVFGRNFSIEDIPRRDIALVRLSRPVRVDSFSSPICLPSSIHENPTPGKKCWIAGWGGTNFKQLASTLQQGDIPVLSNSRCRSWSWKNTAKNYRPIDESMVCAGYRDGGVDACVGDSGGPLMCERSDGSWYLAGIVSWGYNCAESYTPGVYTRVTYYLNWIYQIIHTL